jgi:hypothetical protein
VAANPSRAQNNPICMPHAGSDDTLEAAPIGGYLKSIWNKPWWGDGFASETCR